MKRIALAAFALLCASAVRAETPAANPQLRASANGIHDAAHAHDLLLKRFDVAVEVRGAVAETTVDATFANPTGDVLEGDFRLTLPPGAVVTGYALDVRGQMIDGVLVDRPRAKAVYDASVRRGIDPGVAEVSADNVFETHVYPIWPTQGRRIRLRFVAPIAANGLDLPFDIAAPVSGWSVAVHATGSAQAPVVTAGSARKAMAFAPVALAGGMTIARPAAPDVVVSQHRSGERDLQLGGALAETAKDAPGVASMRIYWDKSRSRETSDIAADIDLVKQAIVRLHPARIELVAFNSSGAIRKDVTSADDAAAWLGQQRYRGAVSYAALGQESVADRCLLFANGAPTIDRAAVFAPRCRLDAISSAPGADQSWLRHVAIANGGGAWMLGARTRDHLLDGLSGHRAGVVGVVDQDGRALPFVPLDAPAGRWLVLVKAPEGGPVTVRLNDAGGAHDVVAMAEGEGVPFDGAGALIAADRLGALGATDQREAYVALSRRYGVASPSLSFLVLETPADYLAAHIEPPPGFPADARDDYLRRYKDSQTAETARKHERLDEVAAEWRDMVAWWSTKFDPNAVPRRTVTSDHFDRTTQGGGMRNAPRGGMRSPSAMMSAAAPMAAPPPPPPPAPTNSASRHEVAGDIVVTSQRTTNSSHRASAAEKSADAADPDNDGGPAPEAPTQVQSIRIDPWQPDRPYLELYDGRPDDFDARFLEAEKRHGTLPIFYLDTAEWLRKHGQKALAIEMVLSALDLPTANEVTVGIVADRLERYGDLARAIELRERVTVLDPDRPQPRRLLALALARRAAVVPAGAKADLTRAIELLYDVAITPHDAAWDGIELIALDEANALLPKLTRLSGHVDMDARLVKLLDSDIRVVIDWTSDGSDMDLWIDEPNKERAIYNNRRTAIGGRLSQDMTRGYGPEEYMLRTAPPGTYTAQVNVYAPDRLDPNGATLVTAHLFRNYGRPTQSEESVDIEVKRDDTGSKMIGTLTMAPGKH